MIWPLADSAMVWPNDPMPGDRVGLEFVRVMHYDPTDRINRLVFADWLDEQRDAPRASVLRQGLIPLTSLDHRAASKLASCLLDRRRSFLARDVAHWISLDPPALSVRRFMWMWVQCWRYRRSLLSKLIGDEAERRHLRYLALLGIFFAIP